MPAPEPGWLCPYGPAAPKAPETVLTPPSHEPCSAASWQGDASLDRATARTPAPGPGHPLPAGPPLPRCGVRWGWAGKLAPVMWLQLRGGPLRFGVRVLGGAKEDVPVRAVNVGIFHAPQPR